MDPDAVDVVELERAAVGAWLPDEVAARHGWLLRAAEGFTGRANSALALTDPGGDLDDVLAEVLAWYDRRDLPALVAVPLPTLADLHDRLTRRGWTIHHGGRVMVRDMGPPPATAADAPPAPDDPPATAPDASQPPSTPPTGPPGPDRHGGRPRGVVELAGTASEEWLARYHHRGGTVPSAGRRMLERGDAVALAAAREDGEVVAIARGAVTTGWLGINAVETAPAHRRRGYASRLLDALVTWGAGAGATAIFLQVDLANDVARIVYDHAGFVDHHTYHYLQPPAG